MQKEFLTTRTFHILWPLLRQLPCESVQALAAQGIEHLFQTVVSTEDVGVDKVRPDVYLEALRRLSTVKATTWVFERDAPGAERL